MSEFFQYALLLSFPIVGCGLFAGGLVYRRNLKKRVAGFESIEGMVVSNRECAGSGDGKSYHPIVEYRVEGRPYAVEGSVDRSSREATGSFMSVMYNPAAPETALLVFDYYFAANMLIALGSAFLIFGSLLAYVLWDAPPSSSDASP